jgi:molecular chaperone DnaK
MVLLELKAAAEAYLGEPVSKAVITVPAYFNDAQRAATREAGQLAGLDVVRMINEPTAAALAYGYGKEMSRVVAIYDLGGGTFDFSVLEISGGVFEVLATSGDTFLGGEDFDDRIILQWLVLEFAQEHRVDLRRDKMAMQRLKEAAEKAKCELSNARSAELNLPFLISRADGETLHLQRVLTRAKLEELTSDLVDRTLALCDQTLREAKVQVDDVILVGGMTRMPLIQERVKAFFKRAPRRDVHPDEVVALGAALQGHSLSAGAASQLLLLDVTPMSLGIMISEGQFNALIPKNTTIPTSKSHIFTTVRDYQTTVRILVLQGESEDATDNDLLGEFSLEGLRPALKGEVEVEVTFSISADGLVSVSAKDLETGREQAITVTAKSNLTPAELKAMAAENQEHLVELRAQEKVEHLRLRLDRTLRSMDNMMPRVKTLLSNNELASEALTKAEQVIERARSSLSAPLSQDLQGDLERLERDHKALTRTLNMFHNVIEKMKR